MTEPTGFLALLHMGDLAQRMGVLNAGPDAEQPTPEVMMDWALHWARRGIAVFPCERFLGSPSISKWHKAATTAESQIVEWWSQWPDADIAGVPDKGLCGQGQGHFVIIAAGNTGAENLAAIEAEYGPLPADFRYMTARNEAEHIWIRGGSAMTSHHRLARSIHVIGSGNYVYLPASWAPDHTINCE